MSSTGFNFRTIAKPDATLHAVNHRYGKTTIMDSHPNIKGDIYNTTTAKTYRAPTVRTKPNWRERVKGQDFPNQRCRTRSIGVAPASGYVMNSTLFDGTGWVPEKNLHTDMHRTEYRNRFNPEKKFHKEAVPVSSGQLRRKSLVYDKE